MKTRMIIAVLAAGTALSFSTAAYSADQDRGITASHKSGKIEKANQLLGKNVVNQQGEKIGDIKDFVVDLESGRILYTLVSSGGLLGVGDHLSAVPPQMFREGEGRNQCVLNVDKEKLQNAPQFSKERAENPKDAAFVREVYTYYNQPAGWMGVGKEARFGNVHRASDLLKTDIKNSKGEHIGSVQNLAVDPRAARVLYVILDPGRAVDNAAGDLYALPPMALTSGTDRRTLITDLDASRLASAPKFRDANWQDISTPTYAGNVYSFYGKQLYWDRDEVIRPTARLEQQQTQDRDQPNIDREQRTENQRNRQARAAAARDNLFGPVSGAQSLIGWDVQTPAGKKIGTLKDLVVDLESGRVLYGIVDEAGAGLRDNKAVAPGAFRGVNEADKHIIAEFGDRKLADAPAAAGGREQFASPEFVQSIYQFYGEQPWWQSGQGTGRFGNVHRASDLIGMRVNNIAGEDFAKLQNVMVDLPDARLAYLLLAPRGGGRADEFIVVAPMALTLGSDGKTLTTNLEGEKLNSAPRIGRNESRRLDDPAFAAQVYRHYGKDAWWQAPTGRQ